MRGGASTIITLYRNNKENYFFLGANMLEAKLKSRPKMGLEIPSLLSWGISNKTGSKRQLTPGMGSIVPSAVTSRQGFKSSESNFCKSKGEVMISVSSKQLTPGILSFISEQDLIKTGSKIGTLWKRRGGVEGVGG